MERHSTDFFGRFSEVYDSFGGLALLGMMTIAIVLFLLTVGRKQLLLYKWLLICMLFSGFYISSIDSAVTLLRWLIIGCLGIVAVSYFRPPHVPNRLLAAYAVLGLLTAPLSPTPLWAVQWSALLLIAVFGVDSALSGAVRRPDQVYRMLRFFLWLNAAWIVLAVVSLPALRSQSRFAGLSESAPLFALTGGVLLPISLWHAFYIAQPKIRGAGLLLALGSALFMALAGQRTPLVACAIGCLPLLPLGSNKTVLRLMVLLAIVVAVSIASIWFFPEHAEWLAERYGAALGGDLAGREQRWQKAFWACLEDAFLPNGVGAHREFGFGFHNAFLVAWYDGGILGLILFLGCSATVFLRGWKITRIRRDNRRNLARLAMAICATCACAGMAEAKLYSPSNIMAVLLITTGWFVQQIETMSFPSVRRRIKSASDALAFPQYPQKTYEA